MDGNRSVEVFISTIQYFPSSTFLQILLLNIDEVRSEVHAAKAAIGETANDYMVR